MTLRLQTLHGPYNGLQAKIAYIRRCAHEALLDPALRSRLEEIVGRGPRLAQVERLFGWIREHVYYVADPVGVEMTKSPSFLMKQVAERGSSAGDCDDQACFAYAALRLVGVPASLRVIWLEGEMPAHIYAVAYVDGEEVPFDTTRERGFGAGSEVRFRRKEDF